MASKSGAFMPTEKADTAGPSLHRESPETQSGTDSASASPATSASSDEEGVPDDLDLQNTATQKGGPIKKGIRRVPEKGARTRKKGQKFQCTGYGDCNLCFTRSEHLSRHIRKHTGEKPYKCFCNRDFSRLDNLRQHAFTVHDASEIPQDWEHAIKLRPHKASRKKEVNVRKSRLRQRQARNAAEASTPPTPLVQPAQVTNIQQTPQDAEKQPQSASQPPLQPALQQTPLKHPQQITLSPQQPILQHQQPVLQHQQPVLQHQQPPLQHPQIPTVLNQAYPPQSPVRTRPQPLSLPSPVAQDNAFQGYRNTTPPQSPSSTPQTPRGAYLYPESSIATPTSASYHHRSSFSSGAQTPLSAGWDSSNRRLSIPYSVGIDYNNAPTPRPTRNIIKDDRKRMTWHAGAEDGAIHGIVDPMERTHLDDPRPRTRPRASTYMPSSASLALPSVESLLNQTESTPRTLPPISGLSPRFAERRAGVRFEHSRSRSASHIQHNVDSFNLPPSRSPYAETVAEQRGQKRPALSVAPPGSSTNVDGMFKTQFQHMRSDSSDALGLPRPMEPSFGATGPEFAPEKSKDAGFVFGNRQLTTTVPLRPRARSSVGASGVSGDRMSKFVFPPPVKENHKMEILEPDVFERRPEERAGSLDFLATVCNQMIEEEKPRFNRIGK